MTRVIVRLDLRRDLLQQFESMDDDLYGRFLEAMDKAGWYTGDDMIDAEDQLATATADWWLVAVELHRQAHPGELPDPAACHSEPCRSLPLSMIARQPPVVSREERCQELLDA